MLASKTVSMSINGAAVVDSDVSDTGGQFTLSGVTLTGGTIVTLYLDTGGSEAGVTVSFGSGMCLIFSPAQLDMTPGMRYLVEITGMIPKRAKKPARGAPPAADVSYVVEWISLQDEKTEGEKAKGPQPRVRGKRGKDL